MKKTQFRFAAVFVLLTAAVMRIINLPANPGFHNDEGSLILAALSLIEGGWNYLGIGDSILLIGWPPFYPWLLSMIFRIVSPGIETLRYLTAGVGLLTTALLVFRPGSLRRAIPDREGLLAGFFWAVLPFAVLYNRLGFAHNFLALLVLIIFWALWDYLDGKKVRSLLAAGLLAGLGMLTSLWMVAVFPIILLTPLFQRRRDAVLSLCALAVVPTLYAVVQFAVSGDLFLYDLRFLLTRVQFEPVDQVGLIFANFSLVVTENWWALPALAGLFLSARGRLRAFLPAFVFVTFAFAARSVALVGIGSYQLLPLLPVLMMGLARFFSASWDFLFRLVKDWLVEMGLSQKLRKSTRELITAVPVLLFLAAPWLFLTVQQAAALGGMLPGDLNSVLIDPSTARQAADYVNSRMDPEDLVIASPAFAWLVEARVTDYQVSLAYDGLVSRHFPADIPRERFVYDVSVKATRFVVMDRVWDHWAVSNVPDMPVLLDGMADWPMVAEFGEFRVYENPNPTPLK